MKICVLIVLILDLLLQGESGTDIQTGYMVTLAVPSEYSRGFLGRAFVMENEQGVPHFRTAVTVEAIDNEKYYSCSIDVLLGDVRVWSSGHLSQFHTSEKCVMELNEDGDLRLKDETGRVGWRSGTSGQGVEKLSLLRQGNLVLVDAENLIKWQSFNFPTDTMLWGQRLSSQTRLTSFPTNSTMYYSLEIQDDNLGLYLNIGKSKYLYWEYRPVSRRNITFVQVTTYGLEIYTGDHKFDQIKTTGEDPIRFLAVDNTTGNLRLYYYANGQFEASFRALNLTCDLPLACKPYGICMSSGSCSCIRIVEKGGFQPDCSKGNFDGFCGKSGAEMVELEGVESVLRDIGYYKNGVSKEECKEKCLEDCGCLGAQHDGKNGSCYLYGMVGGIKEVGKGEQKGDGIITYMVKVKKGGLSDGNGKNRGLKRWVIIVVVVVDGFIILVVLSGLAYYFGWKRRKN